MARVALDPASAGKARTQGYAGSGAPDVVACDERILAVNLTEIDPDARPGVAVGDVVDYPWPDHRPAEPDLGLPGRVAVATRPVVLDNQVRQPAAARGRSLIVENNYGYVVDLKTLKSRPTEPGVARVDIDPNGKGCGLVWENDTATAPNVAPKLSTRTGLVYTITRKYDTTVSNQPPGLGVYYWAAIDFRTGKVVWERQAGTGSLYDSWWPGLAIGPTGTAYVGQYGGIIAIRDIR